MSNNTGEMSVSDNTINGSLRCSGNTAVVGGGNVAAQKQGQCRNL